MANHQQSDVLILGGGTMGIAAGWALARRGVSVTVFEQFQYFHEMGSHGGHTRIFRHCYFEGEKYVPWALKADRLFAELAGRTGLTLQERCGCLDIGTPENGHARRAESTALTHHLPYEFLTGTEVNERFPAWNLPAEWEACLDPEGGALLVKNVFTAFRKEFEEAGGTLLDQTKVFGWRAGDAGVSVETESGTYVGRHLIITAGAWAGKVLADLRLPLVPTRKPVMWFDVDDRELYRPERFPSFIIDCSIAHFYGLPAIGDDSLKMGIHSDANQIDPDDFDREVRPEDMVPEFSEFFSTLMHGVHAKTVHTGMCMYTMTPDEDFIIDRHPQHANVAIAAGFSGHGFKFATVIGEHLADLATNDAAEGRPEFAVARFSS